MLEACERSQIMQAFVTTQKLIRDDVVRVRILVMYAERRVFLRIKTTSVTFPLAG
jgi:hypothetical protein